VTSAEAGGGGATRPNLTSTRPSPPPSPLEPAPQLAALLGIEELWLKREDLAPDGSHKGRSAERMLEELSSEGRSQAVVSSSGNAALALARRAGPHGVRLLALVSPLTPEVKLRRLLDSGQTVVASHRPVGLLHHALSGWGLADLRGSTNRLAPLAYRSLAAELAPAGPWDAVFVYSSSGATALGLCQGWEGLGAPPQVHPVEGAPGGELTRPWYPGRPPLEPAHVGELGTHRSRLAPLLRRRVVATGGRGWRVGAGPLAEARAVAADCGLDTSWEGLAALAAAALWSREASGRIVVVLTGAGWQLDLAPSPTPLVPVVETPFELDSILVRAEFRREGGR
jgi:hypothetical protein